MKAEASSSPVSVGSFDTGGFGWGKSCPADPIIQLGFLPGGGEFVIPLSKLCPPLSVMSIVGVGITLIGAILWVLGGI